MKNYREINRETIDRWVGEGWQWGIPVDHETYEAAKNGGPWEIFLTPSRPVPKEWFGELKGARVLGLAAGGAQQIPIFQALGSLCTVLDYSRRQIESEKMVAEREGYAIETIERDMTEPLPFDDETFDLVFHPVANCYVEKVEPIFQEAYRVLKKGGLFLAGLPNEVNYIVDEEEREIIWSMPFNPLKDPKAAAYMRSEKAGVQFSHTMEEQIAGQLKAGFTLLDLYEDTNGKGRLHEMNIKTFLATKAVK
ncbi:MAG: methyltransferase domain-containing protein [Peptoniphilus sp.]|nr:methyltransferase domain-containing protein [Peptoniphilus sp.]MDY3118226.1 methyltransferase domain-containing protein [Peptoniphilus sp.]